MKSIEENNYECTTSSSYLAEIQKRIEIHRAEINIKRKRREEIRREKLSWVFRVYYRIKDLIFGSDF